MMQRREAASLLAPVTIWEKAHGKETAAKRREGRGALSKVDWLGLELSFN